MDDNDFIREITISVQRLEASLPTVVPMTSAAKIPHKVLSWRESLFYRSTELSRAALNLYNEKRYTSSVLLIRGQMETTAFMFWLLRRVHICVKTNSVGDIDDFLMRGLFGGRDPDSPKLAINVLTAIDHLDKKVSGFRSDYDWLSEFAHPNSFGTHGSYAKIDEENLRVHFGWDINEQGGSHALSPFYTSLQLFIGYYDKIADYMEDFQKLCEEDLRR